MQGEFFDNANAVPKYRHAHAGEILSSLVICEFSSSCHAGLRAGIRVNIDSLAPGFRVKPGMTVKKQARNDSKKNKPGMTVI